MVKYFKRAYKPKSLYYDEYDRVMKRPNYPYQKKNYESELENKASYLLKSVAKDAINLAYIRNRANTLAEEEELSAFFKKYFKGTEEEEYLSTILQIPIEVAKKKIERRKRSILLRKIKQWQKPYKNKLLNIIK